MDSGHSGWTRRGVLVAGLSAISSVATVAGGADTERSSLHSTTADGSAVELTSSSSSFQYNPRNTGYTDSPGLSRQPSQQWEISTDDPPPTVRSPAVVDGVAYTADS